MTSDEVKEGFVSGPIPGRQTSQEGWALIFMSVPKNKLELANYVGKFYDMQ